MEIILLIAEQDQRTQNIIRFTFEQMDYKVVSARSGAEALLKAKELKPDLVLVDVSLPDKSGYEVAREIKNDPLLKSTSVILLISSFVTLSQTRVAECLADDYVLKPFEFAEIIQKVKALTTKRESEIKLPMVRNMGRKDAYIKAILVVLAVFLLAAPILYLNGRFNPSDVESSSKPSYTVNTPSGVKEPPKVGAKSPPLPEKIEGLTITLDKSGEIFINDIKCPLSRLKFEISKLVTKQTAEQVAFIQADPSVAYGNVMAVSDEIKKAGIQRIELADEPRLLSTSKQSDDAVSRRNDSKSSQKTDALIKTAKEGGLEVTHSTSSKAELRNGKKANGHLKVPKTSKSSSARTTKEDRNASKTIGETKKKTEEKSAPAEYQTKTSQNKDRKFVEKANKTGRDRDTVGLTKPAKNAIQIQMGGRKYIVKKGETLWRISKKFDTSVQDLMAANQLEDNNIRYDTVLIVPIGKEESQDTLRPERKDAHNFMKDIKITDWSLYVAWGIPTLHHVKIQNTGNTTYSNIKIKVLYYYSYSTDSAKLETAEVEGILPITVTAHSKKMYLQKGITLKQGSASSMFGGTKEISIIGATPVIKDGNLLSSSH